MLASAATLMLSASAFAQTPAAPAAPAAQASVTVSDAELAKFAAAAADAKRIMAERQPAIAAAADAAAKAKIEADMGSEMSVSVIDRGLTVKRYNEIATAMQGDRALFTRLYQMQNGIDPSAATPGGAAASSTTQ